MLTMSRWAAWNLLWMDRGKALMKLSQKEKTLE